MHVRVLMPCEADKANLPSPLGFQDCLHRSPFGKNAVRVGFTNYLVKLEEIDPVGLKPSQRLVDLVRGGGLTAPIDLRHEKGFLPVPAAQRVAPGNFTLAAVVVPAVVEKIDSFIQPRPDDANAFFRIRLFAKMIAAEPDERDALSAAAQSSIGNAIPRIRSRSLFAYLSQTSGRRRDA